jgi:hypothetical protein
MKVTIPIYLSGAPRPELADRLDLFGALLTPQMGNVIPDGVIYGIDNGCFNPKVSAKFKAASYLAWLDKRDRHSCLFATAPDVVGDAAATLERSLPLLPRIRALGFKAALVAQDGLELLDIPWDAFDVLFIGGSTEWKLGAAARALCLEARARGKWVHVGRVNSEKRLTICAEQLEADSADGTFLKFGPKINIPRLRAWYGCADCRELVHFDEFGLHEGCPALARFQDSDYRDILDNLLDAQRNAFVHCVPEEDDDRQLCLFETPALETRDAA